MSFFLIDQLNIPEHYLERVALSRGSLRVRFRCQSDSLENATSVLHLIREKEGRIVTVEGTLYPKSTRDISGHWRLERVYGHSMRLTKGKGVRVTLRLTPTK